MELSPAEIGEKIKNKSDFYQIFALYEMPDISHGGFLLPSEDKLT